MTSDKTEKKKNLKTEAEICIPGAGTALLLRLQDKPVRFKPVSLILICFASYFELIFHNVNFPYWNTVMKIIVCYMWSDQKGFKPTVS